MQLYFAPLAFKKSQTLDIVKCTGFYCFAGFCFHRSFIKVIFHRAAFLPVVRCLVLDVGGVTAPTQGSFEEYLLIPDQKYIQTYFLPALCARENKKRKYYFIPK